MRLFEKYFTKLWHEAAQHNNQTLTEYIDPAKRAKVLDIAPFRGDLILKRVKNIKKPQIYAVDIDREAVKSCKKLGIMVKQYDIEKGLPYKSDQFDIVSANQIIEHLTNIDLFVKEIHRVLKPNCYVVLSTENLSSWHNLFAMLMGWQAFSQQISTLKNIGNPLKISPEEVVASDRHQTIFTLFGLKSLFELHGFIIEKFFGAGYYPLPSPLAKTFSKLDPNHSAFIGIKARKKR